MLILYKLLALMLFPIQTTLSNVIPIQTALSNVNPTQTAVSNVNPTQTIPGAPQAVCRPSTIFLRSPTHSTMHSAPLPIFSCRDRVRWVPISIAFPLQQILGGLPIL